MYRKHNLTMAELPTHVFMPDDIPTCPMCGSRTHITEETWDRIPQHHKCLQENSCGYEFLVEFETEDD